MFGLLQAQILTEDGLDRLEHVKNARRGKKVTVAVMFFGEYNYGWVSPSSIVTWQQGLEKGLQFRKNEVFMEAVRDVAVFLGILHSEGKSKGERGKGRSAAVAKQARSQLPLWWCEEPMPVENPWPWSNSTLKKEEEDNVVKKTGDDKAGDDAEKQSDVTLPILDGKIHLTNRKKKMMIQKHGPHLFKGKNSFPDYVHVRRNAWTVPRPKYVA